MISVDEALRHVLELAQPPETEVVPLREASGRVLAAPVIATRDQPPFRASVMDGYAVVGDHPAYQVVGEAPAGHAFDGPVGDAQCIRIFTGSVVPDPVTRVVIQEDVTREDDRITLKANADSKKYIRDKGGDFKVGDQIECPCRLTPADVALAASMNCPGITVARRPRVALIATGDELVMPGENPAPDQIIASNTFGLAAIAEEEGAEVQLLPIAKDTRESLASVFDLTAEADLIVTIGGASVGDYDIIGNMAADLGLTRNFYKIAMRPGKPLMAGNLHGKPMLGLPGNPVSSMVCGHLFLRPLLRAMQGLPKSALPENTAILAKSIRQNGPRQHYMRAVLDGDYITAAERQDSSLLTVLSGANALLVRPPHAPALEAGAPVKYIKF